MILEFLFFKVDTLELNFSCRREKAITFEYRAGGESARSTTYL